MMADRPLHTAVMAGHGALAIARTHMLHALDRIKDRITRDHLEAAIAFHDAAEDFLAIVAADHATQLIRAAEARFADLKGDQQTSRPATARSA